METTYEKRGLLNGVGNLYLAFIEDEGSEAKAPTYAEKSFETPSIDQVEVTLTVNSRSVFLSNKEHDNKERVTSSEINLQAGYFPTDFAEEAQGMVKFGEGAWRMPDNPKKKPFRMAFPITDTDDNELIIVFPYCTLGVTNLQATTRKEEAQEQIPTFTIRSIPLAYKKDAESGSAVYYKFDLTNDTAKKAWDRAKLLGGTGYDETTLAEAKASGVAV